MDWKKPKSTPWRVWGRCPGASLPLLSYKSKLLTTKPEARHHLLAEGHHTLQGDKQKINLPSVTWQYTSTFTEATPPDIYPETMCLLWEKVYFLFIALRLMRKPVGWWCSGLKISELAQGFSDGYAINGSQRHSHQQQGGYLGFCQSVLALSMSAGIVCGN